MTTTVPDALLRGRFAPDERTLVEIFATVVDEYPSALALDSGVDVLTYAELAEAALDVAARLHGSGVRRGDRVGVRIRSGTTDLYVAILGILHAGASYVPVDSEDPDDRARLVFTEAAVAAVVGNDLAVSVVRPGPAPEPDDAPAPTPDDDAWVIFTSGSTGTPKGVAVTHRNAAAFVDAEARMFLTGDPIGPGDRVMAGLSVAFDASCEEMWLAWAHGGCLVPAPRSLVRSGVDVGPWLVANQITVVSTVPTLLALWPAESLQQVRLLIMGGEACPPELASRLQAPGREVWNTYGPTEATVVACGALLDGSDPVRIGLPLDGWDLAVVDATGQPVAPGESGELIIGGVGLARYLDAAKDAEKYAPFPSLGWERAYRSGDVVRNDPAGLVFAGRADDQVKLGGRRIELGEIDEHLLRLPGVVAAAAAVRSTKSGNKLLIGYVAVGDDFDPVAALEVLRHRLPAALVPRLAVVAELPTRTSGKVDRDALPWPLPRESSGTADLSGLHRWIAEIWQDVLGAEVTGVKDDFFEFGGGSLTAAQVISRLRERYPEIAVGDLYAHPTVATLAAALEDHGGSPANALASDRKVAPIPRKTQLGQVAALLPLRTLAAARWVAWLLVAGAAADLADLRFWPYAVPLWSVLAALVFLAPPVRMLLAAGMARLTLRGVEPGSYPRGGKVHLRLWLAERVQDELAATGTAGAPWFPFYARLLGAELGRGTDLHTIPPVTGFLSIGDGATVEPEVDLRGYWIDGDRVHIGRISIGADARIGARSTLAPGSVLGVAAEVAPGSLVLGTVPADEFWSGSPAERVARQARGPWSQTAPPRHPLWQLAYAAAAFVVAVLPGLGVLAGAAVLLPALRTHPSLGDALTSILFLVPVAAVTGYVTLAALVLALVRLLAVGLTVGHFPVRSGAGVRIWTTMRVLDEARTWLFPLYSSGLTPTWLRLLGAEIGHGVEASTVLLLPKFTHVNDHAFLADDTLIGGYELGGGWIRVEHVKIGKRAFVGNSGMAAPGRRVPRAALVAVLSAAPHRAAATRGSSWMGSPPTRLRRTADAGDSSRTYDPPRRLRVLRALVELGRVVPLVLGITIHLLVGTALVALIGVHPLVALATGGVVMSGAGLVAAAVSVVAKWLLVGKYRRSDHPLWSGFVWRNELADTFIEMVAAPWFASVTQGTPVLNVWLRLLGAKIGRGVWCDTYWLPETDLIELGDGATVNSGCVVQTHLFHDRVLSMDRVVLRAGATLGPNSVILPAATIGRHATVGPVSLVMRGEAVPDKTRWIGNPIGPWDAEEQEERDRH
ncbi:MAG: amino acid adenylation domain-containing protein [Propionibacteriales bacterium]|nr:amino acid adenylation domain-containing protein [Propionibacteriales bacterium]